MGGGAAEQSTAPHLSCCQRCSISYLTSLWFSIDELLRRGSKSLRAKFGAVAQLVAHLHGMQGVRGSSPLSSTLEVLFETWACSVFR